MSRKVLMEGNYQLNPGASGVGTLYIGKLVPWERLVLITDVSANKVLYNFSDPSTKLTNLLQYADGQLTANITGAVGNGTSVTFTLANIASALNVQGVTSVTGAYVPGMYIYVSGVTPAAFNGYFRVTAATATTVTVASTATGTFSVGGIIWNQECTVATLYVNTSALSSNDEVQITIDEFDERIKPAEEMQDPVGKLRTSAPQSLIDTDFEYSRQDSKWESVSLINNRPFAITPLYNALVLSDMQTSTAGTKTITAYFNNTTVATTASGVQGNGYTTLYTTAAAHNLNVGQFVTITGITPSGYNTTSGIPAQVLAVPSSTTFIIANGTTTTQSTVAGTITSNVALPVGTPFTVTDTYAPTVPGNYVVETRPGETSFTFSAKGSTPSAWASQTIFDPNKTLLAFGNFYAQSSLIASAFSNSGQAVTVTTTTPHGLSIGNEIAVLGTTATTNTPNGNFYVSQVLSPTQFVYYNNATPTGTIAANQTATTATGTAGTNIIQVASAANLVVGMTVAASGIPTGTYVQSVQNTVVVLSQNLTAGLSSTTTTFYASIFTRPQGQVLQRAFDGGVIFNSGSGSNNSQLIRQTRRYFHYQSGKGVQMSSGTILKPTFGIDSLTYSAPYVTVTTKERHGLQPGYQVTIYGANEYGYSGTFAVAAVTGLNSFTYVPLVSPSTANASGSYYLSVASWNGAVTRLGVFDNQNGMFFEYDGQTLWAVRRSSIFQIAGRVSVTNGSSTLTASTNYPTTFSRQLTVGQSIVIRGQSYRVTDIASDTSATIQPAYRGITASNVVVSSTLETRVPQSQWNLDPVNGTGPSEWGIDLTKSNMFYIDYSWYGSGFIRWGVRGGNHGNITYVHKMANNSQNATAYMRSGNLPARYEVASPAVTTTTTASVGTTDTTINVANTYGFFTPTIATTTATGTSGQYTISVGSATGIVSGMFVNATNVNAGTQVAFVSGTTVTLTQANAGAVSGSATFSSYIGTATIRNGSTYETINYTGLTSNTLTGVTRGQAGNSSLALTIAVGSNIATVSSNSGLQVGQRIVSPAFPDGTKIEYIQGTTIVLSNAPTTANPTVIAAPAGATSGQAFAYSATAPTAVELAFPTFAPLLSHWGTSVIMDGLYTPDKNLLFTYGQTTSTQLAPNGGTTATGSTSGSSTTVTLSAANTNIVPGMFVVDGGTAIPRGTYVVSVTSSTVIVLSAAVTLSSASLTFFGASSKALFSIRVAPSVDNSIPAGFGAREVLNRMQLLLNTLDISLYGTTVGNVLVQAFLNGSVFNPTGSFTNVSWQNVVQGKTNIPNSSLAQVADYSTMGATGSQMLLQGGEATGGFLTNSTGTQDISQVRDLGNAILGGGTNYSNTGVYPDGPDTLTIVVTNISTTAQPVLGRISWQEAQA